MRRPVYILRWRDNTGEPHIEEYRDTLETWQRYEELKDQGETLKIEVFTRMIWYPDNEV